MPEIGQLSSRLISETVGSVGALSVTSTFASTTVGIMASVTA